ncbi:JmjC domain-containing protein [Tanacetum coccineum]
MILENTRHWKDEELNGLCFFNLKQKLIRRWDRFKCMGREDDGSMKSRCRVLVLKNITLPKQPLKLAVNLLRTMQYSPIGSQKCEKGIAGDLHWKIVSVYIHWTGKVMLNMKSNHVVSIIKKKRNVVFEFLRLVPSCYVIFDLETLSLSFDFVFDFEISKSFPWFPAQSVRSSNADALDSPYLLVLNTRTSQSRQYDMSESDSYYLFD